MPHLKHPGTSIVSHGCSKPKITLLRIALCFTEDEGVELKSDTWATGEPGASEGKIMDRWRRLHPLLASIYRSHELVTPHPELRVQYKPAMSYGQRRRVRDELMESYR